MAKTTYLNNEGEVIPAYVNLKSATPQDTTVNVTANIPGATEHVITWPAVGSKTQPKVQYYKKAVGLVDDENFADYWLRVGQEAWHNRQQKQPTDWLGKFNKAVGLIGNTVVDGRRNAIGAEPVRQLPEKEKNNHIKLITAVSTMPYMIPGIGLWPIGAAGASLVAGQNKLQKTEEKADGGKVQKDQAGALVFPKGETTYMSPQGRQTILNKKLE